MRVRKNCCIITFDSTSKAIAMEKYCIKNNIKGRIIPVPVNISAECGLCFKMLEEDYINQKHLIENLDYSNIHFMKI